MREQLETIRREAVLALEGALSVAEIEALRVRVLGRKGNLTEILRSMGALSAEERPRAGQMVNAVREELTAAIEAKLEKLSRGEQYERLMRESIDVTEPGKRAPSGKLHLLTQAYRDIREIFIGLGFQIREGPEIEYDKYNFQLLNMPPNHPARDAQDTFYMTPDIVLRTHTSPVQARTMLSEKPPIRILSPGRVFRVDDIDATHSPVFMQIEGLVVDKGITMAHLKGILATFAREYFGEGTKTRFRPGFFPFTEPSAEVDVTCIGCHGEGGSCRICKGTGWIEILGSGMVHPNVLRDCGIDPEEYTGYAFGMGVDRIASLRYGVTDIRLLYENDLRFLKQF